MRPHNPNYQLKIKQTLTVKPDDFFMHVTPRKGRDAETILGKGAEKAKVQAAKMGQSTSKDAGDKSRRIDLNVYYGMSIPPRLFLLERDWADREQAVILEHAKHLHLSWSILQNNVVSIPNSMISTPSQLEIYLPIGQ
jgi:hypothetical protein